MKLKLAVIFGILIWFITHLVTTYLNPIFIDNAPYVNILVPVTSIVITGFFGILYIRTIETNEVVEGFLGGVVFAIMNIICDFILSILPNTRPIILDNNFIVHFIPMIITTLLITTFLGYLAQMNIDLK